MIKADKNNILGLILAGGQSRRMGGLNKSLATINGQTLLEITINSVKQQLKKIIINSNENLKNKINYNIEIVPDKIPGYLGPLSGIFTGMDWAKENFPECKWIASFPVDSIFFPENLIEIMIKKNNKKSQIICVKSNNKLHPVFALWSLDLIEDLKKALLNEGLRKIDEWTKRYNLEIINFKVQKIDPFFNINTFNDLEIAKDYFCKSKF